MNSLGHPALPHDIWLGHSMINRNPHKQEFQTERFPHSDNAAGSVAV